MTDRRSWINTTHDWSATVDHDHLRRIRAHPERYAPSLLHLVLEVVAYAADEAAASGRPGTCAITVWHDGSVSVADDGRGTDTRLDGDGRPVRKPVMATPDLRFFDSDPRSGPGPDCASVVVLPDGAPRRGMSVVAALSEWLVHTNRRRHGSWTQRYEHGIPVTDLVPLEPDGTTGTTVHFMPGPAIPGPERLTRTTVREAASRFPDLRIVAATAPR